MIDLLRKAADSDDPVQKDGAILQMIYMQYLMYESARIAVGKLIEFEPTQSDALACTYCLECSLFGYLMNKYDGKFQGKRLSIRLDQYRTRIPKLIDDIEMKYLGSYQGREEPNEDKRRADSHWRRAWAIKTELDARYNLIRSI